MTMLFAGVNELLLASNGLPPWPLYVRFWGVSPSPNRQDHASQASALIGAKASFTPYESAG
jgi:hypothetical protein